MIDDEDGDEFIERSMLELRRDAARGDVSAQTELGVKYATGVGANKDLIEAIRLLKIAAKNNDATAQFYLSLMYLNGEGVTQSNIKANYWCVKAANSGHDEAQVELGKRCAWGVGVEQSNEIAIQWYREAIRNGNPEAIDLLIDLRIDALNEDIPYFHQPLNKGQACAFFASFVIVWFLMLEYYY